MIKICFLGSASSESILKEFESKYGRCNPENADFLVCIGGDGFLLSMMHGYWKHCKPFYGLNKGAEGFLMNSCGVDALHHALRTGHLVSIFPLNVEIMDQSGAVEKTLAFNEVYFMRSSPQAAKISVKIDNVTRLSKMVCDGVLIATPMGSTAYNMSIGGSIIPLETSALICTPINPFRPRRLTSAVLPSNSKIKLQAHSTEDRPVYVAWDNMAVQNCLEVRVRQSRKKKVSLIFNSNSSLQERMMREQFLSVP